MTLAGKYRPLRLADVVGQPHIKPVLAQLVKTGKVPPAMIFSGTRGTGKTTCARVFAAALNCENPENGDACAACPQCLAVQRGHSSSVMEIDAASSGGVAEVRNIREKSLYGHDGKWRVILLDEAHSMSKEAFNALLKAMEDPMSNTLFLLVTTEPEKILSTVVSRSMTFEFRRIKDDDVTSRLRHIAEAEKIEADDTLLAEITREAQGGLRDAIMLFDQVSLINITHAEDFRDFYGIRNYSLPFLWAAIRGDHAEGYRLVGEHFSRTGEASRMVSDLARTVSELLVIRSEGRPSGYSESALAERVEMAHAVSTEALVGVCEVLWQMRERTRATENDQRSAMDMAFALIANTLKSEAPEIREKPILTTETSADTISLSEMVKASKGR